MSKLKEGDYVKTLEAHDYLDITQNELGRVSYVGRKNAEGEREVIVDFTDFNGEFSYTLSVASSDVVKVGTKLKHRKAAKLLVGDQIVLDGSDSDSVHAEVHTIEEIETDQFADTVTLRGDGFEVVLEADELDDKVPVIV